MNKKRPCIFFDRDGVINEDRHYISDPADIYLLPGVCKALERFKKAGYLRIVITNQSGIAQGLYSREDMQACHDRIRELCPHMIDAFYYAPGHPTVSESLSRKPGSLLFERAMARFGINAEKSWMIGDKDRDLIPAKKLGMRTIQLQQYDSRAADFYADDMDEVTNIILPAQDKKNPGT